MTETHKVMRSVMSPIGVAGVALVVICLTVLVVFRYWGLTTAIELRRPGNLN